jgi:8-oxo-dGTP pyrophosphatase MutT (NUDIX family)
MNIQQLREKYPSLYQSRDRGTIDEFLIVNSPIPEELIGNAYMIGVSKEKYLYIIQDGNKLEIPGGKKDIGEGHIETIKREMLEEAGVAIESYDVFGAWHLVLRSNKSLYPHLPHPEMYMVVGFGEVRKICEPSNPIGTIQTKEVKFDSIENAVKAFRESKRDDLADLYQLAWNIQNNNILS